MFRRTLLDVLDPFPFILFYTGLSLPSPNLRS